MTSSFTDLQYFGIFVPFLYMNKLSQTFDLHEENQMTSNHMISI